MSSLLIGSIVTGVLYLIYKLLKKNMFFLSVYFSSIGLYITILVFSASLILNSQESIAAATKGMQLWGNVIFPALFPFFVCTDLLIKLGFADVMGYFLEPIMRPIFNVPGSGSIAFFLGIISGYPVGAKTAASLKEKGLCTKIECERLLAFCNNAGPLFIFGSVATAMFKMPSIGLLLYSAHIIASITVGIIFRFYGKTTETHTPSRVIAKSLMELLISAKRLRQNRGNSLGQIFEESVKRALNLSISIAGFIIFFSVLISFLEQLKIISLLTSILYAALSYIGIHKELLNSTIRGFFEIASGISSASMCSNSSIIQRLVSAGFILGWAGLSVHFQVLSIISKSGLSFKPYLLGKGLQGVLTGLYTYVFLKIVPVYDVVFSNTTDIALNLQIPTFLYSFSKSLIYLGNTLFFMLTICFIISLRYKNSS